MALKHPETKTINLRRLAATKKAAGRPRRTYITGPDPLVHKKYVAWARARAQAHFYDQTWSITFDQWQQIWGDQWHQRGRSSTSLCLSRLDLRGPWDVSNVHLITRRQHCQRTAHLSRGGE